VTGIEVDGVQTAILYLEEQQHDGIKAAVRTFGALGLRTVLLTGDNACRASLIPIAEQICGLSPEGKLAFVKAEQRNGRNVLLVGDGINDAAAMAASSVSLAVDSGCPIAGSVADGMWRGGSFAALIEAIQASRAAAQTIRSNLWIAVVYNSIGIGIAAFGLLHPVVAALLMTASSLTVTWRALWLLNDGPQSGRRWSLLEVTQNEGPV
jgi:P-type E1-E2 ATPase